MFCEGLESARSTASLTRPTAATRNGGGVVGSDRVSERKDRSRGGGVRARTWERRRKVMCRVGGWGWEAERSDNVDARGRASSGDSDTGTDCVERE